MKRRTGRKLISMLLAAVMVLALLPAAPVRAYFGPDYAVELDYRENGAEYHTTGAEPMKVGNTMVAYPMWQGQYGNVSTHYFDWEVKKSNGSWSTYQEATRPGQNTLKLTEDLAGKTLRCYIYFDYEYPDQDTEYRSEEFTVIGEITSAEVTIPAPVGGQKVRDSYLVSVPKGQHFTVTNQRHYVGDRGGINWSIGNSPHDLTDDDVFKTGEKYTIYFFMNADKGWRFAKSVRVKVNGVPAKYSWSWDKSWAGEDYDKGYSAEHSLTAEEPELVPITSVECTLPKPKAGQIFPRNLTVPADAPYELDEIQWYEGKEWTHLPEVPKTAPCVAGKIYWAWVFVRPKAGYQFIKIKNTAGDPSRDITMTLNGVKAKPEDGYFVQPDGRLSAAFPFKTGVLKKIHSVEMNVPVPVAGQLPAKKATIPSGANYYVDGVIWKDQSDGGRVLKSIERFQAGHDYQATVVLHSADGYYFYIEDYNVNLNDRKVDFHIEADVRLECSRVYPCKIPIIEVSAVTAIPTLGGEAPKNIDMYVPDGAGYSAELQFWYDVDTQQSVDIFEADHKYRARVKFTVDKGEVLSDTVKYTINGQPAQPCGGYYDSIVYEITADTKPVPKFLDVKTTDWFFKFVQWAVDKNITAGTSKNPPLFSPNDTCVNCQIITFIWNSQGQPKPNIKNPFADVKETDWFYQPALWAYENGLVSGTKFNPNQPCTRASTVLYLWRFAGKPSAPLSKFNDVNRKAEYADAVDWAVANGVTAGNGAGGFSPSEICSRAQIVTFIYNNFEKNK